MKLILDANILVSAYAVDGRIREYWRKGLGPHQLLISPEILTEVESALRRTEFHLSDDGIRTILVDILDRCDVVRPRLLYAGPVPDENDRHVVSLAKEVGADRIITGDEVLQKVESLGDIPVMPLAEFLKAEGLL